MMFRSSRVLDLYAFNLISKRLLKRFFSSQKTSEPLRILFCGSDNFSIASLRALREEQQRDQSLIASIDVVCRPPKPFGRGLKKTKTVAISKEAKSVSLPLHEIDSFTGWTPPMPQGSPINLIIAVSFGRFVPPRILNGAQYGGLNVHPSMLPDFYGPAPLYHTVLQKCPRSGITLQTMDPHHFDQGLILDQTPFPGYEHKSKTARELSAEMGPLGAEMLVRAIRNRSFVAPYEVKGWKQDGHEGFVRHAPKITSKDKHIDWSTWTADDILHIHSVLGPLWNNVEQPHQKDSRQRRVIWSHGFSRADPMPIQQSSHKPGMPYSISHPNQSSTTYINTSDGQVLVATRLKLDGEHEKSSKTALDTLASDDTTSSSAKEDSPGNPQMLRLV